VSELVRKADIAEYKRPALAQDAKAARGGISVRLLNATPDPLGSVAALCAQYTGRVVRDLSEVTDAERRQALADMQQTVLNGPLEVVQFHWQIEGITRAIANQATRSRASFFAQESLRFAVADDWAFEVPLPPSLAADPNSLAARTWVKTMVELEDSYNTLIAAGMPAEEARGVLPLDMPTRLHWVMDLRTLLADAGKRTCTQAQFPWRIIFSQMAKALREYRRPGQTTLDATDMWQYALIADMLRPVCYQTGQCGFMAKFDRGCSIRGRVDANAKAGRPSSEWATPKEVTRCAADSDCPGGCGTEETVTLIDPIKDHEWAADPGAARVYEPMNPAAPYDNWLGDNTQEPNCDTCQGNGCGECGRG
jgi:flavin-dependent thymidylate synthase